MRGVCWGRCGLDDGTWEVCRYSLSCVECYFVLVCEI